MESVLKLIVSPKQGAFILGQNIFDNITIAQEMVHSLNKATKGRNILIKVGNAKAYDTLRWDFLFHVLNAYGFSLAFCNLIKKCVAHP